MIKRALAIGMITMSLSVTACGGKKAEPVVETTTVVETTVAETTVAETTVAVTTDKSNDELLSEMKVDMESGNLTRDDIEWLCDTQFLGASADYIANAKKELHAICDKLDQAKPAESLSESKPVVKESKESKESKPANPVEKPVSKPVETKPVVKETQSSNSGTTLEGQALLDEMTKCLNDPDELKITQDSVIDGTATGKALTPEEQQITMQ